MPIVIYFLIIIKKILILTLILHNIAITLLLQMIE